MAALEQLGGRQWRATGHDEYADMLSVGLAEDIPTDAELGGVGTITPGEVPGGPGGGRVPRLRDLLQKRVAEPATKQVPAGRQTSTGIYIGEGLPPVPAKMAEKIAKWEFIEMHELLPDLLTNRRAEDGSEKPASRAKGRKRVQDISAWLQCYAVFVSVVARSNPEAVPELMAYMAGIIRASQEFEGSAWSGYDAAFRRQAAATGQREWSKINSSLYAICFTGKARRAQRCDICFSAAHRASECDTLDEDPDMAKRVKAVESALVAFSTNPQSTPGRAGSSELCRLYNGKGCHFRNCKFRHACKWCDGCHAALDCRAPSRQDAGAGPIRREPTPRGIAGGAGPPY